MNKSISVSLTVYFECPFWIGVFERTCGQTLQAHRIIFGSTEPKDYFVYDIILHRYQNVPYGKAIDSHIKHQKKKMNPKRMQRQINRMLTSSSGVSTKAQEAMRISRESQKTRARQIK